MMKLGSIINSKDVRDLTIRRMMLYGEEENGLNSWVRWMVTYTCASLWFLTMFVMLFNYPYIGDEYGSA